MFKHRLNIVLKNAPPPKLILHFVSVTNMCLLKLNEVCCSCIMSPIAHKQ